jgi:PIN domain nuclease of toxin-antitoxin system
LNPKRGVLDASALLTFIWREEGGDRVAKLLPDAVIPASALVEVLYRAAERDMNGTIADLHQRLLATGLEVEPLLEADVTRAAELIATSRKMTLGDGRGLSLGDGLCIAVAERRNVVLISEDAHWFDLELKVRCVSFRTGRVSTPKRDVGAFADQSGQPAVKDNDREVDL